MRGIASRLCVAVAALAVLLVLAAPALAAPHFDGSFPVSGMGANNLKMVEGPDGNVWMTLEGSTKDVAKITPAGAVTEFEFEGAVEEPSGIAAGPEGAMWVTTTKGVAKFAVTDPTKAVETPIASITGNSSIVAGPDGQMWVATKENVVHFLPTAPAGAKPISVPTLMQPHDIDVAGSLLVIADGGSGRILTMTTAGVPKDVAFARNPMGTGQGIAGSPSGQFSFSESDGQEGLALATPPNPATAVAQAGDPFGVARGSDGAYYFAMSADEIVRRLSADGTSNTAITGLPKGFHPRQITAGAKNTIWVASENNGTMTVEVVRISGLEPPVTPPSTTTTNPPNVNPPAPSPPALPQTALGKVPKKKVTTSGETADVKFSFSSTTAGASFECSLGRKVKPKGKKARFVGQAFKGCKSPKTYTLKPGKYRFQVRALSGSARDSSPAQYSFKVIHAAHK